MNTLAITVDKNRPIPPLTNRRYPFGQMEVGDSFWLPIGQNEEQTKNNIRCAASAYGRRKNMRFSVRKSEGGLRVWRVK